MPVRPLTMARQRLRARLSAALASERGSFLIEIVVSAALIGVVTIAVFATFDGANAASGRNKARSVANSLAEQDQERLRAMPVQNLGAVSQTQTKTVDGVDYTVVSKGQWITETTGANTSCTGGQKADYVRISSQVSWPNMRLSKPLEQDSIVSPGPGTGGLGVLLKQRDGVTGTQGIPVSLSGPQSLNGTTDTAGCTFFGGLSTASYTIGATATGYTTTNWGVDPSDGISPTGTSIGDTFTPTAGSTTVKTYLYDKAATVNATVNTKLWDGTIQNETTDALSFENPNLGLTGVAVMGKSGVQRSSYSPSNVFPFSSAYSVYSGGCLGNNPKKYTMPPAVGQSVQADPAGAYNIAVREPAMNILVKNGASVVSGSTVKVTPDTASAGTSMTGCSASFQFTTNSAGKLPDPAVPYGWWVVCADGGATNRRITKNIQNTNADGLSAPGGVPTTVFDINGAGSVKGTC
jgi:Tfp pilus assembly protein PilE